MSCCNHRQNHVIEFMVLCDLAKSAKKENQSQDEQIENLWIEQYPISKPAGQRSSFEEVTGVRTQCVLSEPLQTPDAPVVAAATTLL
jgi:hypothetical protein